jgi:hypothetical protein
MKTLPELIADIPQDDKRSVESIAAYLNSRPQTATDTWIASGAIGTVA